MIRWYVNYELERVWQEKRSWPIEVISRTSAGREWGKPQKPYVRIAGSLGPDVNPQPSEYEAEVLGENLPRCNFVQHKSHWQWAGTEAGRQRWEAQRTSACVILSSTDPTYSELGLKRDRSGGKPELRHVEPLLRIFQFRLNTRGSRSGTQFLRLSRRRLWRVITV